MCFTQRNDACFKRQDPDPPRASPIINNQNQKTITDILLDGKHFSAKKNKLLDMETPLTTVPLRTFLSSLAIWR